MSTNICELTNEPITFKIGDRELKIKRLNLSEMFGYFETKMREQHMANIRDVASLFTDKLEKAEYLSRATKEIPNKTQLKKIANEYIQTEEGMVDIITIGVNKCQKLSDDEITEIFKEATQEDVQLLISYLFGIDLEEIKANDNKNTDNTENTEEKKTITTATTIT